MIIPGRVARVSAIFLLFVAGAIHAAEGAPAPVDGEQLVDTGIGLLIVVALIVGLAWLFRRFGHMPFKSGGEVRILGGVSLGARERAVLLQVEGEQLLVGVAPGQVRMLHVVKGSTASVSRFEQVLQQESEAVS